MRLLLAACVLSAPLFGCSCLNTATPCSYVGGTSVIFVGRGLVDSGEGWGTGPSRVVIEEALQNVPKGLREVDVDTAAGTSCYRRIKAGERYVIFADHKPGKPLRPYVGGCTDTFLLKGKEQILEALRNGVQGGSPRLIGTVWRSTGTYSRGDGVPGARVVARSDTASYDAFTDGFGRFEIRGIAPGRHALEVSKPGFAPDDTFNKRWSGRMVLNPATNSVGPDKTEPPGSVWVGKACEIRDLALWPHGRISGLVTAAAGGPLAGVTVQAFAFDQKGERESQPLRTAETDARGRYVIEPLPGGEYVVGVNASTYKDEDSYPPTLYTGQTGARVPVADGEETPDINLVLPARRTAAKLKVRVLGPDGNPYCGAVVTWDNLAGVQRGYSDKTADRDGIVEIPVYVGEQYIVQATAWPDFGNRNRKFDYLGGSSRIDVSPEVSTVTVTLGPRWYKEP